PPLAPTVSYPRSSARIRRTLVRRAGSAAGSGPAASRTAGSRRGIRVMRPSRRGDEGRRTGHNVSPPARLARAHQGPGEARGGVSKPGGIFVHKSGKSRFGEKSTTRIRERAMQEALTAAQEAEVKELAEAIAQAASDEFLQLARALVRSGKSPFG